jgi:hypothetical protein
MHQGRDMKRRIGLLGVEACHRAPEDGGIDLALVEIVDHGFGR